MGIFDDAFSKVGLDAANAQRQRDKITKLEAELLTANADRQEEINAEIAKLRMLLAAGNKRKK